MSPGFDVCITDEEIRKFYKIKSDLFVYILKPVQWWLALSPPAACAQVTGSPGSETQVRGPGILKNGRDEKINVLNM